MNRLEQLRLEPLQPELLPEPLWRSPAPARRQSAFQARGNLKPCARQEIQPAPLLCLSMSLHSSALEVGRTLVNKLSWLFKGCKVEQ